MIICRTPFRISFFGGGTDFPAWYKNEGGAVISTTINKYCYINIRQLPRFFSFKYRIRYFKTEQTRRLQDIKHPSFREALKLLNFQNDSIEIVHNADLPALSGMGASSSATVCLLHAAYALRNLNVTKKKLSLNSLEVEQKILKEFVGSQDQISTAYGGFNHIQFNQNSSFEVKPISNKKNIKKIEKSIVLIFTGLQRKAQIIEKDKIKNMNINRSFLSEINSITNEALSMINQNLDIKKFGELLNYQWNLKKKLSRNVSNKVIDEIYSNGLRCGAYGGKLLGAGNGGFILFICNEDVKKKIYKKFKSFLFIPIKFDTHGSQIIYPKK